MKRDQAGELGASIGPSGMLSTAADKLEDFGAPNAKEMRSAD